MILDNYIEVDISDADAVIGEVITGFRCSSSNEKIDKLVLQFESGAVLSIDGRFPARACMVGTDEELNALVGKCLKGLVFLRARAAHSSKTPGHYERDFRIVFDLDGVQKHLEWRALGNDAFDVDPAPRVFARAAFTNDKSPKRR